MVRAAGASPALTDHDLLLPAEWIALFCIAAVESGESGFADRAIRQGINPAARGLGIESRPFRGEGVSGFRLECGVGQALEPNGTPFGPSATSSGRC